MNLFKLKENIKKGKLNIKTLDNIILSKDYLTSIFFTSSKIQCVVCSTSCINTGTIEDCSTGCVSGCHSTSCAKCSSLGDSIS